MKDWIFLALEVACGLGAAALSYRLGFHFGRHHGDRLHADELRRHGRILELIEAHTRPPPVILPRRPPPALGGDDERDTPRDRPELDPPFGHHPGRRGR